MDKKMSEKNNGSIKVDVDYDSIDISGLSFEDTTAKPVLSATKPVTSAKAMDVDVDLSMNEESEFAAPKKTSAPAPSGAGDLVAVRKPAEEDSPKGRIGERLVSIGLITKDQLNVAIQEKKISGKMLGQVLVDLKFITEETLSAFLAESSGFEVFNPKVTVIDGAALALIEKSAALKHQVLPVSVEGNVTCVAMSDPYNVVAMDTLRRLLPKGMTIKPLVAASSVLSDAIDAAYGYSSKVNDILKELESKDSKDIDDVAGISEEEAFTHPIVRLVNALVSEAVRLKASDLHFEPEENFVRLRLRVDGDLFTSQILHKQHWNAIAQRLKIMANLNIADKITPQDGRINVVVNGKEIDFRVSSLPTVHGENIVMRVLDKNSSIKPLASLGFSAHNRELIRRSQERPEGIIIVTGPTGSGKTTSLYSMLNEINTVDIDIQTLEDPVEYSLPMIRQTPVREGILEFADGIRALLRQDPDVIFIGEVRDKTTATMALQAAMTGHQVYTSLHTNDSFGALPRLMDLGMVPGMVAGNIISVFAQRLVRTLCPHCKEPHEATPEECAIMKVDPAVPPQIFRAKTGGCQNCGGAGYKGRVAVVEILFFDEELDAVVASGGSKIDLKAAAIRKGFKSMKDDGIIKVLEGVTTLDALSKVVDIHK